MNRGYGDIGDAIYALVDAIDIDSAYPDGWSERYNTMPKLLDRSSFPAFAVAPVSDTQVAADKRLDDDTFQFWVLIIDSFFDSPVAEDRMRSLVDLVRERLREERDAVQPFGLSEVNLVSLTGEWEYDEEHGYRFYRLGLSVRVQQDL